MEFVLHHHTLLRPGATTALCLEVFSCEKRQGDEDPPTVACLVVTCLSAFSGGSGSWGRGRGRGGRSVLEFD
jgi:hypothetical protein